MSKSPVPHRRQVEKETRRVLEAFLQGALSNGEAGPPGHVGGSYHDPESYMHRSPAEHGPQCPAWTPVHEEINRVEERKHGFRTSLKHLLRRRPSPRRPSPCEPSDSLPSSKDSLKRSKAGGEGGEGTRQKRAFSFKNLLRKKGATSEETAGPATPRQRPDSLPLDTCYCRKHPAEQQEPQAVDTSAEDDEFYTLVAQKLEHFVKQQQRISPVAATRLPSVDQINTLPTDTVSSTPVNLEELQGGLDEKRKEQILQKLIALLEEQAGVINKEIEADPLLRSTVSRLSYRSFSRMAEVFTSRTPPGVSSPQLAKLALTMELTRKVAGINSHAVHTLMGYSLQYMDMFVPWLQQQGGWENIVAQDEIFDLQLD
ncbi:bcl-2-like protein 12 [Elgaria multicarinata webbii]|uniref:bcl-2-like protein 12 n=1 Tax=Elgaria multicarinata webbii TaxID=159646 RepID=UPI002FCD5AED